MEISKRKYSQKLLRKFRLKRDQSSPSVREFELENSRDSQSTVCKNLRMPMAMRRSVYDSAIVWAPASALVEALCKAAETSLRPHINTSGRMVKFSTALSSWGTATAVCRMASVVDMARTAQPRRTIVTVSSSQYKVLSI